MRNKCSTNPYLTLICNHCQQFLVGPFRNCLNIHSLCPYGAYIFTQIEPHSIPCRLSHSVVYFGDLFSHTANHIYLTAAQEYLCHIYIISFLLRAIQVVSRCGWFLFHIFLYYKLYYNKHFCILMQDNYQEVFTCSKPHGFGC